MTASAAKSKTRKPLVPAESEVEIAQRVCGALAGLDGAAVEAVSAPVAASLQHLHDVAATVDLLRSEQPRLLEGYADDLVALVRRAVSLPEDEVALLVYELLGSTVMARLLADAASGNIQPLAATPKRKTTQPVVQPVVQPVTGSEGDPTVAEPEAEAPKPRTRRTKKTAAPAVAADLPSEPSEPAPAHEYTPGYSGMVCDQMVLRDGHGDQCGLGPAEHSSAGVPVLVEVSDDF